MLKYKWPGNVRQLKNITEQMSVLSQEREIDAKTLLQFIPKMRSQHSWLPFHQDGTVPIATRASVNCSIRFSMN